MTKTDVVVDILSELVELAMSYAETHLDHNELADFLSDVVDKGNHAYEMHTGETLNPDLVEAEDAL